jgi:hypothetical protein
MLTLKRTLLFPLVLSLLFLSGCENLNEKITIQLKFRPKQVTFNKTNNYQRFMIWQYAVQNQSRKPLKEDEWYYEYGINSAGTRKNIVNQQKTRDLKDHENYHSEYQQLFTPQELPQGNYTAYFRLYLDEDDPDPFKELTYDFPVYVD